ncbi:MAG: tripartite tricarboxylate transporter substrate binding protein, partial [Betaproteobacteria bacterium]
LGSMAPAGIPKAIMDRIHAEMVRAVRAEDVQARFAAISLEPETTTPAGFKALLKSEYERWGRVVKEAGVKLD